MNTISRQISTAPVRADEKEAVPVRTIRFASDKSVRKIHKWARKKFSAMFRKLAE